MIINELINLGHSDHCESCGGDGIERCNNPDHSFIEGLGGELNRLGCPVCGHDEYYRVKGEWKGGWGKCEDCNLSGKNLSNPLEKPIYSDYVPMYLNDNFNKKNKIQEYEQALAEWQMYEHEIEQIKQKTC